jgi:hypothetical protein
MRTLSSALSAVAMIAACDGATAPFFRSTPDDSQLPGTLRAQYLEDAARLALRDLLRRGYAEIEIPSDARRPYYDALVLVHNATGLPARDSVVNIYRIHTFPLPATRSLMLQLVASEAWVQRLARRELPTGEPAVDDLLQRYSLSVGSVFRLSQGDVLLTLGSLEPLNMAALAPQFRGITGVRHSDPNGAVGDGNDIRGSIEQSRVLLDYSVGYGDCPAGCIRRHHYHFAVHTDGTVEYLGASGAPPPPPHP